MDARHVVEEHRGELQLRLEAPSLAALFVEAGRAVAELMRGDAPEPRTEHTAGVTLSAGDREALLVDWVNELVYRAEVDKVIFDAFEIHALTGRRLEASIRGARVVRLRNPVKAATYHGLSIEDGPGGLAATLVLDV